MTIGARPIDSSSTNSRRGPAIKARQGDHLLLAESVPPVWSNLRLSPKHVEHGAEPLRDEVTLLEEAWNAPIHRFSSTVSVGKIERPAPSA